MKYTWGKQAYVFLGPTLVTQERIVPSITRLMTRTEYFLLYADDKNVICSMVFFSETDLVFFVTPNLVR